MFTRTTKTLLALLMLLGIFFGLTKSVHATEGCNAVGWDEPHGMIGCELYYPAVSWLYKQGIAHGDGSTGGKFHPDRSINRAEFTKMTLLTSGIKDPLPACVSAPFPDVPKSAWFAAYVCAAKAKGIIGGFPDGTFKPELTVHFADGAKILANTFEVPTDMNDAHFDADQNIWYRPYTQALLRKGAVAETIGVFSKELTRGEMAEMLYRLKTGTSSINKPQPPKDSAVYPDDDGLGFGPYTMDHLGFSLSSEPDPPFIFTPSTRMIWMSAEQTVILNGYAFSHVLQHERCGASGLFGHCTPTFTDWSVGLYPVSASPDYLLEGLFDSDRQTRYFGGKPGTCARAGIEGEYTETCVVPWTAKKTLVVMYDYIDTSFAYTDMSDITPTSFSDAMYARIRKSIQFE